MAPQTTIPLAANILGTIGTIFWCIQLLPQIWYNWRQKKTDGLPGIMMFLWATAAIPFGVYAIVQNFNIPIQIQPQVFCALSLVSWAQILAYNNGYGAKKASILAAGIAAIFGGVEVLLIVTLRPLYDRGIAWPITIVGVVAAILLAAGLLPPYVELRKREGRVVGINFAFLIIDWLGALFSLMGVVAQETFDPLGGCLFIVCIVIEGGIFISHGIWLLRTRKLRKAARAAGKSIDDLPVSDAYHVDVPRKGSIAASRDVNKVGTARRHSVALARDLEKGEEMFPESVKCGRSGSVTKALEPHSKTISNEDEASARVREAEIKREGIEAVDYGTMAKGKPGITGTRPGYVRQDSDVSNLTFFKELQWNDDARPPREIGPGGSVSRSIV